MFSFIQGGLKYYCDLCDYQSTFNSDQNLPENIHHNLPEAKNKLLHRTLISKKYFVE